MKKTKNDKKCIIAAAVLAVVVAASLVPLMD